MKRKPVHVVIWLPKNFYGAVAATLAEMFELVNTLRHKQVFSFEFVAGGARAETSAGVFFKTRRKVSRRPDVLIVLAVPGMEMAELLADLERESRNVMPLIRQAFAQGAILAAHCSASYFLARSGLLDGRSATVSWWLKEEMFRLFPKVRWDPSRLVVRDGRLYSCGGGFSGLELAKALLKDLGMEEDERLVRKLLVLPPSRHSQTPYEMPLEGIAGIPVSLRERLDALSAKDIASLDLPLLARRLALSPRTLARRFADELGISPGQWIKDQRLTLARTLLEETDLDVSEICYRIGYEDPASFNRLFSRVTGMPPGEYRRQSR